jgi:hypothetical protein
MKKLLFIFLPLLLIIFFSCHQNVDSKQEEAFSSSTDSTNGGNINTDSIKLIKTASIKFKINNVENGIKAVSGLTRKFGGMIYGNSFQATEGERNELQVSKDSLLVITNYTPQADINLRVPSDKLEEFLFSLAELGYYTNSSSLQIDDKSLLYLQNQLKNINRTEVLKESKATGISMPSVQRKIEVKDDIIDQQIENKAIDSDVKYSLVSLSLYQNTLVKKEMIANYNISQYSLPFSTRLSNALNAGWNAFLTFILVLAHLWVFILLTAIGYISYRFFIKKKRLHFSI